MKWVLRLPGPEGSPRLREVHTPEEVVHPTWADGTWTATVRTASARDALLHRRYGFEVVGEIVDPRELPLPLEPERPRKRLGDGPLPPGFVIRDTEPVLGGPRADWQAWQRTKRGPVGRVEHRDLLARLRAPVPADVLDLGARVARSGTHLDGGEDVAVVNVFHGRSEREDRAVDAALDAACALGPRSRIVVVQNDPTETRPWEPRANRDRLTVLRTPNRGFAAACNAGAKAAGSARWLLFTQPDVSWSPDAVRDAIGLARAFERAPTGFGRPAVVGPSGGYVDDLAGGGLREVGRNAGVRSPTGGPIPVDWLAGYWLLVDGEAFRKVKGWCDRFFLYYEDPDLVLRLALAGCRPFAWPGLQVDHERGGTIRSKVSDATVAAIQAESRAMFGRRWGG